MIPGIGKAYQAKLTEMGETLRTMAEWNADDIDRVGEALKFPKIREERWVEQAQQLLIADGEPLETVTEPEPSARPSRAEVLVKMSQDRKPTTSISDVDDDPLPGMGPDEIKALARRAMGNDAPRPVAELQKRGNVAHLKRTPDAPSVVAFDRKRGVLQRLNRHKKFAFITGDFHGAHFSQRGRYFDHEGIEIPFNPNGRPMNEDEVAELYVDEDVLVTDPDDVNLGNWYEGKVEYPLELVIKAIQRTYRKKFDTVRACKAFLHQVLRANIG